MEDNEIFGEQPESVETSIEIEENEKGSLVDSEQEQNVMEEHATSEAERGVPIGKFNSVEDLVKAYNNLQAEFTRKSQKLSQLEKDKTLQTASTENKMEAGINEFLSKNQDAVLYVDEIKSRVEQDEKLLNDDKAFEKVWADMLYEKLSAPNRAEEPLIQNIILKDNGLKNLVIENYMKQLQERKTPIVMSSGAGERVTKTVAPKPDSFEQAKKVVFDLLS